LTNNHVIEGADQITVRLIDRREYSAEVVGVDPRSDLALLKVDAKDVPYLEFSEPGTLRVGEWVLAIGSPFGLDYSASVGIVSAIGRSIPNARNENYVPFIQTDVAINPGNSGGPLFNLNGDVVGINSQIYTRSGGSIGLSFAVPASVAQDVVAQLKSKGHVDRGWLGVVIQPVDKDLANSFNLGSARGALVAQLEPGGPADEAGIQVGDIILEFNGVTIDSSNELPHVVGSTSPGQKVPVEVLREGKIKKLTVEVGSLPGVEGAQAAKADTGPDRGGRMGVAVTKIDDRLREAWRLDGGVLVEAVEPNSPAAETGLRPGDVIVQLGFQKIDNVKDFRRAVKELPGGKLLPIRFFRDGMPTFRTIKLPK
jgi:serine protease Do